MKEAQQHNGGYRKDPGSQQNHSGTKKSRAGKQRQQSVRRNALHQAGTDKTSSRETDQVEQQAVSRQFRCCSGNRKLREPNYEARHSDLRANVEKLRDDSPHQVPVSEHASCIS